MASSYPAPKFHFRVDWGGKRIGFTEVTGLDVQVEAIEYRDGNHPEYSKIKMPGLHKFSNITLKRGTFQDDTDFFDFIESISLTNVTRRDVTIMLLDETHSPIMTWKVKNAFPVKYQGSDLKADGNEVAIETLELAHEGLTLHAG